MNKYQTKCSKLYSQKLSGYLAGASHYNFLSPNMSTLNFSDGRGSRLYDLDGNEYLDLYGKSGALFLGHRHPEFLEYLNNSIHRLIAVDMTGDDEKACRHLCQTIRSCERVRFSMSGSEAIQNAFRLARVYTGRQKIVRFEGHYHGSFDNVLYPAVAPKRNAVVKPDRSIITLAWNSLESLDYISSNYADIAAVISEPVMLNGGGIMASPGYLQKLQLTCNRYGIVFILDEVITGIRVGMGGAQKWLDLNPDISIWGKAIGNGIPISVIAGKAPLMELYEKHQVVHAGTFNGYPLGLAAIDATYSILFRLGQSVYTQLDDLMRRMKGMLQRAAEAAELDLVIQGAPNCLILNCSREEVTSYGDFTGHVAGKNTILRQCLQSYGILLSPITRLYPSISLSEEDLTFAAERFYAGFRCTQRILGKFQP